MYCCIEWRRRRRRVNEVDVRVKEKKKRKNERVGESRTRDGRIDREKDGGQTETDGLGRRITYVIFYSSNEFYYFIVIQNRLRNPFRLINRCSPRIVYEFGRLIEQ